MLRITRTIALSIVALGMAAAAFAQAGGRTINVACIPSGRPDGPTEVNEQRFALPSEHAALMKFVATCVADGGHLVVPREPAREESGDRR